LHYQNAEQRPNVAVRQGAKAVRVSGTAKLEANTRAIRRIKSGQPALAMAVPGAPEATDASFQEF